MSRGKRRLAAGTHSSKLLQQSECPHVCHVGLRLAPCQATLNLDSAATVVSGLQALVSRNVHTLCADMLRRLHKEHIEGAVDLSQVDSVDIYRGRTWILQVRLPPPRRADSSSLCVNVEDFQRRSDFMMRVAQERRAKTSPLRCRGWVALLLLVAAVYAVRALGLWQI